MMKKIRGKSVLIIDDDTGILRALDKVLTSAGADVTRAQYAGEALEVLTARKEKFDLVITDLRMPFVTGLTIVYAIHKIYPALPVIVLTAFGSANVKAECFNQGAAAFLEKPLDASELLAAVGKVFASKKRSPSPVSRAGAKRPVLLKKTWKQKRSAQRTASAVASSGLRPAQRSRYCRNEKRNKSWDTDHNTSKVRTNKTSTTVIIGVITRGRGPVIGVTAAESGTVIFGAKGMANTTTGQMPSSSSNSPQSVRGNERNPFQETRNMQAQMDRMFNEMNEDLKATQAFTVSPIFPVTHFRLTCAT